MIFNAFKDQAPKLPDYQARYRIIYFEPIVDSGERFSIGIMAQANDGESRVIQTLDNKTIRHMYGDNALQINNLIALILESAKEALESVIEIDNIFLPMGGTSLSKTQTSYSNQGMQGILFQALTSYSSLYKGEIIEAGFALQDAAQEDIQENSNRHLLGDVKDVLNAMHYNQKIQWQSKVNINTGSTVTIDVLAPHYNANLSNFNIKHVQTAFNNAKSKLFDLELIRNSRQNEVINNAMGYELLVSLNPHADERYSEQVDLLTDLADTLELRVISCNTPKHIAEHIILKNAA